MAQSTHISDLLPEDELDLAAKRDWVLSQSEDPEKLATTEGKLHLLDTIIQRRSIKPEETVELQALGVVFGDAVSQELQLKWCMFEDEYGRDPALLIPDNQNLSANNDIEAY